MGMAKVPQEKVKEICKPGTTECCRYLVVGGDGFECAKHTSLKGILDTRAEVGQMRATGDNCDGEVWDSSDIIVGRDQ